MGHTPLRAARIRARLGLIQIVLDTPEARVRLDGRGEQAQGRRLEGEHSDEVAGDAEHQREAEALDRTDGHKEEREGRDQRDGVGIERGGNAVLAARDGGLPNRPAHANLLAEALEYED